MNSLRYKFILSLLIVLYLQSPSTLKAQELKDNSFIQKPKAVFIEQKKLDILYNLGIKYYRQKKYKDALDIFESLNQLNPHYKNLDYYLNLTKEKIKESQKKEEELQRIAKEKYISNLYACGLADMMRKDYQKAIEKFEKVLEVSPQHEGALKNLATVRSLLEEKRKRYPQEKENALKEALRKKCELLYQEAKELLNNNWPQKALEKFEELHELDPNYKDVKEYLVLTRMLILSKEKEPPVYTLGPDDLIEINVLGHPELSGSVTVEAGGEIILPLIKEVVQVNNLTVKEATEKIKEVLSKYIKEPDVQLVITGYYSKKWYILGETGLRGEFPLGRSKLTLMEALYRAGLPIEDRAAMRRVLLIKPHRVEPFVKRINVASILYEGKMADNVYIEPGDIIYIPKTVLYKVTSIITQITAPFTSARDTAEAIPAASTAIRAATPIKEVVGPTPESKK